LGEQIQKKKDCEIVMGLIERREVREMSENYMGRAIIEQLGHKNEKWM